MVQEVHTLNIDIDDDSTVFMLLVAHDHSVMSTVLAVLITLAFAPLAVSVPFAISAPQMMFVISALSVTVA